MKIQAQGPSENTRGEVESENVDLASTAALPCGQEAVGNVTFLIGMSQWECHICHSSYVTVPVKECHICQKTD